LVIKGEDKKNSALQKDGTDPLKVEGKRRSHIPENKESERECGEGREKKRSEIVEEATELQETCSGLRWKRGMKEKCVHLRDLTLEIDFVGNGFK